MGLLSMFPNNLNDTQFQYDRLKIKVSFLVSDSGKTREKWKSRLFVSLNSLSYCLPNDYLLGHLMLRANQSHWTISPSLVSQTAKPLELLSFLSKSPPPSTSNLQEPPRICFVYSQIPLASNKHSRSPPLSSSEILELSLVPAFAEGPCQGKSEPMSPFVPVSSTIRLSWHCLWQLLQLQWWILSGKDAALRSDHSWSPW